LSARLRDSTAYNFHTVNKFDGRQGAILRRPISFVIRTYNESAFIGRLFDTLDAQSGGFELDITVVDSGSTDGTPAIARKRGVRLIEIPKASFHYSKALNLGIENSLGDLIVVLSAHSIPCTNDWLARMVPHFDDANVAGVFSRQVPWPGAYWREVVRINRMFGESPKVFEPRSSRQTVPFSNAASCIRRSVWQEHPFSLPAAEDIEWATWAVSSGYRIVYEVGAAVYHSHDETSRQAARRLIELEKAADIQMSRRRKPLLTARQSIGAVLRDAGEIRTYEPRLLSRVPLLWESARRSFWFVRDFER
jgi:cellulose synthase/poly-beta-1,6-N-acetylglucosamine synthase-like glycosyltransferase